jgi:hypothetical protein
MTDKKLAEVPVRASVIKNASKGTLKLETGKVTFSPVSYNVFEVGSVSIEVELPSGVDIDAALSEMDAIASEHFGRAYVKRLNSYLKALHFNDAKLKVAKEAQRG